MVNKTSTIKRIYGSSENLLEAVALSTGPQKCEVDVQMRRTLCCSKPLTITRFTGLY